MKIKEKLLALLNKLRGNGAPAVYYEQQMRAGFCKRGEETAEDVPETPVENWHKFRITIPLFDIAAVVVAFRLLRALFGGKK